MEKDYIKTFESGVDFSAQRVSDNERGKKLKMALPLDDLTLGPAAATLRGWICGSTP